jgi:hypothetical protein
MEHVFFNIPIVNVVRGSSKFNCNIAKSYLKNYYSICVRARGPIINACIWVACELSKEYTVTGQYICTDWWGQVELSFLVTNGVASGGAPFCQDPEQNYIKIGRRCDIDAIKRIISSCSSATLLSANSGCERLCTVAMYACSIGFAILSINCIETRDSNGSEKAGLEVYIVGPVQQNVMLAVCDEGRVQDWTV